MAAASAQEWALRDGPGILKKSNIIKQKHDFNLKLNLFDGCLFKIKF